MHHDIYPHDLEEPDYGLFEYIEDKNSRNRLRYLHDKMVTNLQTNFGYAQMHIVGANIDAVLENLLSKAYYHGIEFQKREQLNKQYEDMNKQTGAFFKTLLSSIDEGLDEKDTALALALSLNGNEDAVNIVKETH